MRPASLFLALGLVWSALPGTQALGAQAPGTQAQSEERPVCVQHLSPHPLEAQMQHIQSLQQHLPTKKRATLWQKARRLTKSSKPTAATQPTLWPKGEPPAWPPTNTKELQHNWRTALKLYKQKLTLYQNYLAHYDTTELSNTLVMQDAQAPPPQALPWWKKKWKQLRPTSRQHTQTLLQLQAQELVWLYQVAHELQQLGAPKLIPEHPPRLSTRFLRLKKIKAHHILNQKDFQQALHQPQAFQQKWLQQNKKKWLIRQHAGYALTQALVAMSLLYTAHNIQAVYPFVKLLLDPPEHWLQPNDELPEPIEAQPHATPEALEHARQQQQQAWQQVVKLNHDLCDINLSHDEVVQLEHELQHASQHYTELLLQHGSLLEPKT